MRELLGGACSLEEERPPARASYAVIEGSSPRRPPLPLGFTLSVALLKLIVEQADPHFHLAVDPLNYIAVLTARGS